MKGGIRIVCRKRRNSWNGLGWRYVCPGGQGHEQEQVQGRVENGLLEEELECNGLSSRK